MGKSANETELFSRGGAEIRGRSRLSRPVVEDERAIFADTNNTERAFLQSRSRLPRKSGLNSRRDGRSGCAFAQVLSHTSTLKTIQEQVRFARARLAGRISRSPGACATG